MSTPSPSPLCEPDYLRSPEELAPSRAPHWLKLALAGSGLLLAALLGTTLLGPMDESIPVTGEVRAAGATTLFSPVAGVLGEILVREGDTVAPGQVILRLDPRAADEQLAAMVQAQAESRETLSLSTASSTSASLSASADRLDALQARLRLAREARARHDLTAPAAGRVLTVFAGQPGEATPLGAPLVTVVEGDAQDLHLNAGTDRLARVQPGLVVRFRIQGASDRLARPALARIETVVAERIVARVAASVPTLPQGAKVEAEIVLHDRPFWRFLYDYLGLE